MNTAVSPADSVGFVTAETTFAQRLERVLKDRGWKPYEWSKRAGLSNSHVQNMIDRNAAGATTKTVHKLAVAAGVSEVWLARGEGAIEPSASTGAVSVDVDDPKMKHRDGFDGNLRAAKKLRHHDDYVWEALAESDPLVVAPLTPSLLADLADVLAKYIPAPEPTKRK